MTLDRCSSCPASVPVLRGAPRAVGSPVPFVSVVAFLETTPSKNARTSWALACRRIIRSTVCVCVSRADRITSKRSSMSVSESLDPPVFFFVAIPWSCRPDAVSRSRSCIEIIPTIGVSCYAHETLDFEFWLWFLTMLLRRPVQVLLGSNQAVKFSPAYARSNNANPALINPWGIIRMAVNPGSTILDTSLLLIHCWKNRPSFFRPDFGVKY